MADAFKTLIFLHIPKAGGNSFLSFLTPNYPEANRFDVSDGLRYVDRLNELESLPDDRKGTLRLIYGHLPFGVHEWIPQTCQYITVLRDPVDRVLSQYYFIRERKPHPLHEQVVSSSMTIADFVKSALTGESNNGMVRLLCGRHESDSLRGHEPCRVADLETAKRNIDAKFLMVGLLEQMHQTQQLLARVLGWEEKEPVRRNQTRNRKPVQSLSSTDREVIEQYNELDMELYNWASTRFRKQCEEIGINDASQETGFGARILAPLDVCRRFFAGRLS
ncbi:MAG: sulfotransferase family 2 domain-containing protein [Planctomycetota bacterium]